MAVGGWWLSQRIIGTEQESLELEELCTSRGTGKAQFSRDPPRRRGVDGCAYTESAL